MENGWNQAMEQILILSMPSGSLQLEDKEQVKVEF